MKKNNVLGEFDVVDTLLQLFFALILSLPIIVFCIFYYYFDSGIVISLFFGLLFSIVNIISPFVAWVFLFIPWLTWCIFF
ncbi:hypothetical protein A4G18_07485 [Pasteurellaceae bacterium Pebbles2]|nr:hypothetical protein [Pasteurellaceae bacterium Pebbles2]